MSLDLGFAGQHLTRDEMQRRVALAAGGFAAAGVRDGDVVASMLRNEPALIELMLAARLIGAYHCAVNWHFMPAEADFILRDSGARWLVIHADLLDRVSPAVLQGLGVIVVAPEAATRSAHAIADADAQVPAGAIEWSAWRESQQPYSGPEGRVRGLVAYTSGTTGRPKGVRRLLPPPEQAPALAAATARLLHQVYGVDAASRCLVAAPLYHSAPWSYASFCAQSGAWLHLMSRFDAEQTLATIERERISHLYLVPTMYVRLLRLPAAVRERHDLGSVRFVASTGSPCPPEIKRQMIDWWGPVITESYASSETGYLSFISAAEALQRPGSAGRAVGGATLAIRDPVSGALLPAGEPGLIYARQADVPPFTYIGNDAARRGIEVDGLVTLGDTGHLDADGYLYVQGRASDMVISGGVNIYPAEIEAMLMTDPRVADCAVFGVPDAEYGEALVAVLQPRADATLDAGAVREFLLARIARYKVPRRVEIAATLPREDTGKIFKRRLREQVMARDAAGGSPGS